MTSTVVVIGGGYGGMAVASALDDVAEVVLVEPRDAFVHNVAALRGLVDPQWTDRIFFPYDRLLTRGRVIHDRAAHVTANSVVLGSGQEIPADFVVLATGSSYPFPAKTDIEERSAAAAQFHATREELTRADDVLLLGAGPVGLELAGELTAAWPDKTVTIVDPAVDVLSGAYPAEFRAELRRQLDALGVRLLLGTSLRFDPPTDPGQAKTFTVHTRSGTSVTADVWFRCFGVVPSSGYLADDLATARRADGHLEVTPELRLSGQDRVFAIGDVTAVAEAKTAKAAGEHAEVVAANIRALIEGGTLTSYTPAAPAIALPLGPRGGATYSPDHGILGPETTSQLKGADLRTSSFAHLLA